MHDNYLELDEKSNIKIYKDGIKAQIVKFLDEKPHGSSEELATVISKECNVDLTIWRIKNYRITGNVWTVNGKFGSGDETRWSEAKNSQLKIIIDYERIAPDNKNEFIESLVKEISTHSPVRKAKKYASDGRLLLLDNTDLHLGRLAYGAETGDSYDIKIAIKRDDESTAYFLGEAEYRHKRHPYEKILMVFGNDYFNYTHAKPFTQTSNGTYQESDSRWQKMFLAGYYQAIKRIESASSIAPVTVIFIPGSHDEENTFYMSVGLQAYFRNNPNITVIVSPRLREFYRFGKNLLGFDHGQYPTFERLFANMAFSNQKDWAETVFKYYFTGHLHHKETKARVWQGGPKEVKIPKGQTLITEDLNGILFDRLTSLTSNDYYEHSRGFIHIKNAEAFEFDKELGKTCTLNYQLPLSIQK
jgi:hypothetical protein